MDLSWIAQFFDDIAMDNRPMRNETEMYLSELEGRMLKRDRSGVTRTEPYYAERSKSCAKWVVMRGPTVVDVVELELRSSSALLPPPKAVRGPLTHDKARSLARQLNKQHAEQQL